MLPFSVSDALSGPPLRIVRRRAKSPRCFQFSSTAATFHSLSRYLLSHPTRSMSPFDLYLVFFKCFLLHNIFSSARLRLFCQRVERTITTHSPTPSGPLYFYQLLRRAFHLRFPSRRAPLSRHVKHTKSSKAFFVSTDIPIYAIGHTKMPPPHVLVNLLR